MIKQDLMINLTTAGNNSNVVTALHWIKFTLEDQEIEGVIFSDKGGDVRFFNSNKLPTDTDRTQEVAVEKEDKGEEITSLLFAHQDSVNHMKVSKHNEYISTSFYS